ncbi:MAG: T9SS type A sorting domain-containing protein [Bacteroidetes bacterium]|nr:T9SS type A sorting domain-containing protein [Bacteroidota bacterium]MBU2506502.1 T9SS type A sorting domain-containing protein [Bacteroidota bacterium]
MLCSFWRQWLGGCGGARFDLVKVFRIGRVTTLEKQEQYPESFELHQNYPNPFNPTTTIKYTIANPPLSNERAGEGLITLPVYDILGKKIQTLVNESKPPGNYKIEFNAAGLPSGVYFYRLETEYFNAVKKMLLLR